jgi:broad specificity phosphatase PhoE
MEYPLSDVGREQARLAGEALAAGRLDAVYSSPLGRALETAEIIARETGFREPIVTLADLQERYGGALEGTTHAERAARNPELTKKFLSLPEEERWTLVGAETDEDVIARFEAAISTILAREADDGAPGKRIAVVSHGGVMRAFLRDRFGPGVLPGTVRAANASITRLELGNGGPRLLEVASTQHLPTAPRVPATE